MANKFCFLPYDMDTAIGTNNEGGLVFGYELEDTDTLSGSANVFNGQTSVLWCNLRDAFGDDIASMYRDLRQKGLLSYEVVEQMFESHQAKWCEAIFNEDAQYKYVDPLLDEGNASYLSMLQGSKEQQRKWWLYNRFRYLDSKYNAGDALTDVITLRGYAKANITVKPYADIYASVKYGSYLVQKRALRSGGDVGYTLICPLDNVNDTEIYIYSASQLKDIGDLSGLKVGYADFSNAKRLQQIILGSKSSGYTNENLTELYVGNNTLLKKIQCANCPNLKQNIDMSGCTNVEEIDFTSSAITGVSLPKGGILKVLRLPITITMLELRNQTALATFDVAEGDYANLTSLWLENNSSVVKFENMLMSLSEGTRVRVVGIALELKTANLGVTFCNRLDKFRGIDANGNTVAKAQIIGTMHIASGTSSQIADIRSRYSDITVTCDAVSNSVKYYNYDGSELLYEDAVVSGNNSTYRGTPPTKVQTAQYTYAFIGWSKKPNSLSKDDDCQNNITKETVLYAAFSATLRTYTARFYNGSTLLQTVESVPYGTVPQYTGSTPIDANGGEFIGWSPTLSGIMADTSYYAQFEVAYEYKEITDSWEVIIQSLDDGSYKTRYKVGNYKNLDLGALGIITYAIVGKNVDTLESGGTAKLSWYARNIPTDSPLNLVNGFSTNILYDSEHPLKEMQFVDSKAVKGTAFLGEFSDTPLYYMLQKAKNYIPEAVRNRIVPVYKPQQLQALIYSDGSDYTNVKPNAGSYFDLWFPACNDLTYGSEIGTYARYPNDDANYFRYAKYINALCSLSSDTFAYLVTIGGKSANKIVPLISPRAKDSFDIVDETYDMPLYYSGLNNNVVRQRKQPDIRSVYTGSTAAPAKWSSVVFAFGFCLN